jgi:dimethylamine/trimethylamine dehydrogenase
MTNEQPQIHRALFARGIAVHTLSRVANFENGELTLVNQFTTAERRLPCRSLLIVGARFANDSLHGALALRQDDLRRAGTMSVTRVGDAAAPGAIVHAVYSGHRYARELDADRASLTCRRDAPLNRQNGSAAGTMEHLT